MRCELKWNEFIRHLIKRQLVLAQQPKSHRNAKEDIGKHPHEIDNILQDLKVDEDERGHLLDHVEVPERLNCNDNDIKRI